MLQEPHSKTFQKTTFFINRNFGNGVFYSVRPDMLAGERGNNNGTKFPGVSLDHPVH
jgi:hypothetical protein